MKFYQPLILLSLIILTSCNKHNAENWGTLKKLYKTYENGEISKCKHDGETVYKGSLNGHDLGSKFYDEDGNVIGTCSIWATPVDAICNEIQDCEVIYRIEDNVWGLPSVDKYGLGK